MDPKVAGLLGDLWSAANTPIAGTPKLIAGRGLADAAGTVLKKETPLAKPKTLEQVYAARRASYRPKAASVEAFFDELLKLGAVSDEQARRSLDRLDTLEKNQLSAGQVGRYGTIGAGLGGIAGAIGHHIEGKPINVRTLASGAAKGAIAGGLAPLIRNRSDQHAEVGRLKQYMQQEHLGEYAKNPYPATDYPTPTGLSR